MAGRRPVSNPLALAVLSTLSERPMHPYEMATTMRSRGKELSIKLNYGSLYTVVGNLAKHGLIEAMGAGREGRRPERTVYRLTDAGRKELEDWMAELIAVPVKEYPQFEAALSELPVLAPGDALQLLRDRVSALEQAIADTRAQLAGLTWLPRLFVLEAELRWVRGLVAEFENRTFPDLDAWQQVHDTGVFPREFRPAPEGETGRADHAAEPGPAQPTGHARKEGRVTD